MAIEAVVFDLDDTLLWDDRSVKESFEAVCQFAASKAEVDPELLEEKVREAAWALYATYETYPFTQNIGINPMEGLWGNFHDDVHPMFAKLREIAPGYRRDAWTQGLKALGVDDPALGRELADKFHAERRTRPIVYEETYEVLDALKGKYKLVLLTNGSPDLQSEKLQGEPKLAPYFDHIVISGSFGEGKPSPQLYAHVLGMAGIAPQAGVMVGDKLTTDIKGANGAGMPSVWINRHNRPLTDDAKPDFEIRNLRELLPILDKLNA
ncbi:HAD family hydrolase [Xylanibacillus composti]|uniref:Phosphoserine phosphatase n=1 Tax=Xylanibacillus composti TaxID=1572762 RepID=A0A8J4H262_9BACL|nr:HAD family hydrolase [Xylanibacillus composti]MDT9724251.1 HAD family hydrolase [Xylanibacillus composti]GIQ69568.1 putative uncharacterized hydrolase YsaA [Xylanibacillus composti]